jgi:hypothetical protein
MSLMPLMTDVAVYITGAVCCTFRSESVSHCRDWNCRQTAVSQQWRAPVWETKDITKPCRGASFLGFPYMIAAQMRDKHIAWTFCTAGKLPRYTCMFQNVLVLTAKWDYAVSNATSSTAPRFLKVIITLVCRIRFQTPWNHCQYSVYVLCFRVLRTENRLTRGLPHNRAGRLVYSVY